MPRKSSSRHAPRPSPPHGCDVVDCPCPPPKRLASCRRGKSGGGCIHTYLQTTCAYFAPLSRPASPTWRFLGFETPAAWAHGGFDADGQRPSPLGEAMVCHLRPVRHVLLPKVPLLPRLLRVPAKRWCELLFATTKLEPHWADCLPRTIWRAQSPP